MKMNAYLIPKVTGNDAGHVTQLKSLVLIWYYRGFSPSMFDHQAKEYLPNTYKRLSSQENIYSLFTQ